jgi:hypothetical protein
MPPDEAPKPAMQQGGNVVWVGLGRDAVLRLGLLFSTRWVCKQISSEVIIWPISTRCVHPLHYWVFIDTYFTNSV